MLSLELSARQLEACWTGGQAGWTGGSSEARPALPRSALLGDDEERRTTLEWKRWSRPSSKSSCSTEACIGRGRAIGGS